MIEAVTGDNRGHTVDAARWQDFSSKKECVDEMEPSTAVPPQRIGYERVVGCAEPVSSCPWRWSSLILKRRRSACTYPFVTFLTCVTPKPSCPPSITTTTCGFPPSLLPSLQQPTPAHNWFLCKAVFSWSRLSKALYQGAAQTSADVTLGAPVASTTW